MKRREIAMQVICSHVVHKDGLIKRSISSDKNKIKKQCTPKKKRVWHSSTARWASASMNLRLCCFKRLRWFISSTFSLHWHVGLKNMEYPCVSLGKAHCMQQWLSHWMGSSCCSFCAAMWLRDGTIHCALQGSAGGVKHGWEGCWAVQGAQRIRLAGIKLRCKTRVCPERIVCISGSGPRAVRSNG